MMVKTGIDLVYLPHFKKSLKNGGEKFLQRLFHPNELKKQDPRSLAGIFAAKEAVIKALSLPPNAWSDITIRSQPNGAPQVELSLGTVDLESNDLSISHDQEYVVAQFIAVLKTNGAAS